MQTQTSLPKRTLGRSDLKITVLTFGCWQAGGSEWNNTNDDDSLAAMRAAYEAGITSFDTAEVYGGGHSEELLGRFASEVGRENLQILTKVNAPNLAADKVRESCDNSLQRLGIERIDLYQIHWPAGTWGSPLTPIAETMAALGELQQQGKIRAIGASNFNASQLEEALEFGRIDSLQPPYSLFFQPYVENQTQAFCIEHQIGVIPYSPLAQGLVTGKFSLDNRPTDNRAGNHLFKDPTYGLALEAVDKLRPIAEKYGATTAQLSIAWLLAQPGVISPIVGARNAEQIQGIVPAATLRIDETDVKAISQIAQSVLESLPQDKTNPWQ